MSSSDRGLTETELREGLYACLHVRRWVEDVMAHSPYTSLLEILDVAAAAATPLSPAEIDEALADHPRIGERPSSESGSAAFSSDEQQASASSDEALAQALADGNAAYEAKFDRVFLVRAAGRDRETILGELHRRLQLDPDTELANVASELRDIALLRIPKLFRRVTT
ncbi:MAG TPA: 2-oxo-4-hydroxy-4-carboxy-5-ureidoimidazoline decarboxylase [Propionibacteriaceae bacterium]